MTDILVPHEQEGTKAVVRAWLKRVGDRVELNDPLVELETDKVTQEVPAPASGVLAEIVLDTDADAMPGAVLGRLADVGATTPVRVERSRDMPSAAQGPSTSLGTNGEGGKADPFIDSELRLSPSVKRAIKQHGIDPSSVAGSGRGGRVTRADVDRHVADQGTAPPPLARAVAGARPESKSIPHDRMRKAIAENLTASVMTAPHVTAVFECDMSAIITHRAANKTAFEAEGAKLTLTAYFVAAAAEAMKAVPEINSRWHDDRLEIFDAVNVGVGTALGEKGLVVPVVQGAHAKSLAEIAAVLQDLTARARADKLTPADMRGGTFTISNHGVSGSVFASPIIIVQPQSAILGIGKTEKRVVVREIGGADLIEVRPMAYVSLTIDHRVVDGHQTNAWLSRFVEVLEGWAAA